MKIYEIIQETIEGFVKKDKIKYKPVLEREIVVKENINESFEKLMEEFSYEDYFDAYNEMAHNILQDFLYNNNEDFSKNIGWTLLPFQLLKSTWEDWVKMNGEVRYPQNVEKIENKLYRNILMISVITEMCGHKERGEYYMSENNDELNEIMNNFFNWKNAQPIDRNQLEMDFETGGGTGTPTVDTNFQPSDYQMKLYGFLDKVYDEKGLEEYSTEQAKAELLDVLLEKWYWKYAVDPKTGHNYVSDYGLEPLEKLLVKLGDEEDVNKKIPIIDQILNVAHQRSDLAGWLVQGGSSALSALSGYGELEPEDRT